MREYSGNHGGDALYRGSRGVATSVYPSVSAYQGTTLEDAEKLAIGQERRTSGANARCGEAGRRIFNRLWPD